MRRLTAIILPFSLALASGAFASSSSDAVDRSPSTSEVETPTAARSTVRPTTPPDTARRRSLSPEQRRAIADRLDRMTPRMRQAVLGRLAKMSGSLDEQRRVRRAGPSANRGDEDRRGLRDRRSRRDVGVRTRSMNDRSRRGVDGVRSAIGQPFDKKLGEDLLRQGLRGIVVGDRFLSCLPVAVRTGFALDPIAPKFLAGTAGSAAETRGQDDLGCGDSRRWWCEA